MIPWTIEAIDDFGGGEGGGFLRVPMKLVNHKRITFKKLFENVFYYYIIYVSICKFFVVKLVIVLNYIFNGKIRYSSGFYSIFLVLIFHLFGFYLSNHILVCNSSCNTCNQLIPIPLILLFNKCKWAYPFLNNQI